MKKRGKKKKRVERKADARDCHGKMGAPRKNQNGVGATGGNVNPKEDKL